MSTRYVPFFVLNNMEVNRILHTTQRRVRLLYNINERIYDRLVDRFQSMQILIYWQWDVSTYQGRLS